MQVQQRIKDSSGALAAVVWLAPRHVTIPSKSPGPIPGPDPLQILVIRRCDTSCHKSRPDLDGVRSPILHTHYAAGRGQHLRQLV